MAGDSFGLKRAIDEGTTPGPRIYPSGGIISQTGGHGDFRLRNQPNPVFKQNDVAVFDNGTSQIADGVPLVLSAARENLRKGASQIKLAAGGGYGSPADPLTGNQY
jgi:imidazolonepropionase-like amidohydrolase